jgi:hypothetical protein
MPNKAKLKDIEDKKTAELRKLIAEKKYQNSREMLPPINAPHAEFVNGHPPDKLEPLPSRPLVPLDNEPSPENGEQPSVEGDEIQHSDDKDTSEDRPKSDVKEEASSSSLPTDEHSEDSPKLSPEPAEQKKD